MLTHLASHGFVTLCANSLTGGPNAAGNLTAMREGLDWLLAQNDAAGPYQGKLDVKRAVTMGYSIGATASVQLSEHPAIATSVVIHGQRTMGDPHGPVLMITGTMVVIDDMRATLGTLDEAPAVLVALPIGHLAVLGEPPRPAATSRRSPPGCATGSTATMPPSATSGARAVTCAGRPGSRPSQTMPGRR